jgi:hypothetical protein
LGGAVQVGARLNPVGDRHWAVGIDQRTPVPAVGPCCEELRTTIFAGPSKIPLRTDSPLGREYGPTLGLAFWPGGDRLGYSLVPGFVAAFPVRISAGHHGWEKDEVVDFSWILVPSLGVGVLVPLNQAARPLRAELSVGFSVRLQFYTCLLP